MKKWNNPELMELGLEKTKDTRDFPHYWECNACGKHNVSIIDGKAPERCYRCGSTDGFTFRPFSSESDAVTQPNFNGPAVGPVVEIS